MSFEIVDLNSSDEALANEDSFSKTVLKGLSKEEKRLPSWLIFDDRGSELFNEITELEYYPPAVCEVQIFERYKQTIANTANTDLLRLIELGSGDGTKTLILLEEFIKQHKHLHYAPIDISAGAIRNLVNHLESKYKDTSLSVTGFAADYFQGLSQLTQDQEKRNFVLFLGSTIGNQSLPEASTFLRRVSDALNEGDYFMIGFDLFTNPKLHYRAYNDPEGAFENFNLHLLDRINRTLGANFEIEHFMQEGHYNWRTRAVESYIYSLKDQTVWVDAFKREFQFREGEGMQTEHSYKYTLGEIEQLATTNGFEIVKHLFDPEKNYVDSIWRVKK